MSNLQPNCYLKVDFQKLDKHTEGKWLIHDTNAARTISFKAWNFPAEYPIVAGKVYIMKNDTIQSI